MPYASIGIYASQFQSPWMSITKQQHTAEASIEGDFESTPIELFQTNIPAEEWPDVFGFVFRPADLPCRLVLDLRIPKTVLGLRIIHNNYYVGYYITDMAIYIVADKPAMQVGTDVTSDDLLYSGAPPTSYEGLFFYPPCPVRTGQYLVVDIISSFHDLIGCLGHVGIKV